MILLLLTTAGCATKNKIVLPPKPEREELPEVTSAKDLVEVIVYYEYLVQEWEEWGDTVSELVEN